MRVLQLGPLYNGHLRRWSEHAAGFGWEVHAAGHVSPGRRQVDLGGLAAAVHVLPPSADRGRWLAEVIESVEPDLVQAHFLTGWVHTAATIDSPPVLATPWGSDLYLAAGGQRVRADAALAGADRVIARSPHMRRELIARGVAEAAIADVDLGVDLERFRPPAEPATEPRLLSFRAGTGLYNLHMAVDALARVRERRAGTELVLARGDAPAAPELADRLGRPGVRDLGPVEHREIPRLMRGAAAGISIPSSDGSPSSVWEALACGLPLVVSNLPQVRERLEGCAAVRFVEPEAEEVAAALLGLLTADRAALSVAARGWAVANAGRREQSVRLERVYAAMAGSATGARGSPASAP